MLTTYDTNDSANIESDTVINDQSKDLKIDHLPITINFADFANLDFGKFAEIVIDDQIKNIDSDDLSDKIITSRRYTSI